MVSNICVWEIVCDYTGDSFVDVVVSNVVGDFGRPRRPSNEVALCPWAKLAARSRRRSSCGPALMISRASSREQHATSSPSHSFHLTHPPYSGLEPRPPSGHSCLPVSPLTWPVDHVLTLCARFRTFCHKLPSSGEQIISMYEYITSWPCVSAVGQWVRTLHILVSMCFIDMKAWLKIYSRHIHSGFAYLAGLDCHLLQIQI